MFHSLRRYATLAATDRWLLARAYVEIIVVDIALRLVGFRRLAGWTEATEGESQTPISEPDLQLARTRARWTYVASRHHFVRARCLHRSLALHRQLRRLGLPSRVRLGVRKENGELLAHAWVELGDQVVNDDSAVVSTFTPLIGAGRSPVIQFE